MFQRGFLIVHSRSQARSVGQQEAPSSSANAPGNALCGSPGLAKLAKEILKFSSSLARKERLLIWPKSCKASANSANASRPGPLRKSWPCWTRCVLDLWRSAGPERNRNRVCSAKNLQQPYGEGRREKDDDTYRRFQNELAANPQKGPVVRGSGRLRKRFFMFGLVL